MLQVLFKTVALLVPESESRCQGTNSFKSIIFNVHELTTAYISCETFGTTFSSQNRERTGLLVNYAVVWRSAVVSIHIAR